MTDLLTTTEAARRLGISGARVRVLLVAGRIRGTRIGRAWVVTPAEVRRFAAIPRPAGRQKGE